MSASLGHLSHAPRGWRKVTVAGATAVALLSATLGLASPSHASEAAKGGPSADAAALEARAARAAAAPLYVPSTSAVSKAAEPPSVPSTSAVSKAAEPPSVPSTALAEKGIEGASPTPLKEAEKAPGPEYTPNGPDGIVGGTAASSGEFPYFVSLQSSAGGTGDFFCGGSLMSVNQVLTAAHCVDGTVTPAQIQAVIGGTTLAAGNVGVVRNISAINIHPSWNPATFDNDVAILTLTSPLLRTDLTTGGTQPEWIRLAQGNELSLIDPGDTSTVIGHGAITEGGSSSNSLLKVAVPIQSDAAMSSFYGAGFHGAVMVGAGPTGGGQDSCQGDSGGPLIITSTPQDIQFGDVSWGSGCARPNFPGVYGELYQGALASFVNPLVSRPFNDNFPGAGLVGNAGQSNDTNTNATQQPGESNGEAGVWYSWTPSESGNAQVTVNNHAFDSTVDVYTGTSVTGLTLIAANDDANGSLQSEVEFNAVAGVTYRIRVDGFNFDYGSFTLSYGVNRPANDDFANAQVLSGTIAITSGSNVRSTGQAGEPNLGSIPDATVWYSWTAPASGTARFTTYGSSFDSVLTAVTGSAITGLTTVASNDDFNGTPQSLITFPVTSGTTYRIWVDGFGGTRGSIQLQYSLGPPANDMFASPEVLTGALGTVSGSNTQATAEPGEPNLGSVPDSSVWYSWAAPASGTARFTTYGSPFDTVLTAVTGSAITGLTTVATNDDFNGTPQSLITFPVTLGTTYRFWIDGFGGSRGSIQLQYSLGPPANDMFASPQVLTGFNGIVSGSNTQATAEPGEPTNLGSFPDSSVWYSWAAPASGTARFTTNGSSFDTVLAALTGSAITGLTTVASNDDFNSTAQSLITFPVTLGTTYRFWIDGFAGSRGSILLQYSLDPPANDMFASPEVLSGAQGTVFGDNVRATGEPGEPTLTTSNNPDSSVWYSWTAPATGTARFSTGGSSFESDMAVVTGATIGGLTTVASNFDYNGTLQSLVTFPVTSGTTYRIWIDGHVSSGSIKLTWGLSPPGNDLFASAPVVSGASGTAAAGTTANAVAEPGEPNIYGATNSSVWYSWVAPSSRTFHFAATGGYDHVMAVYTGPTATALTLVAIDDDSGPGLEPLVTFAATSGTTYRIAVDPFGFNPGAAFTLQWAPRGARVDFDGDGDTDRSVFRNGAWFAEAQATAFLGSPGDIPVPDDYDGNGTTERAVFRPSSGAWYVDAQATVFLGVSTDVPVPGDYDGNGTTERAVFRPSVGGWYVDGQAPVFFGLSTDVPVPGDYDGNGTTDLAVFRPSVGGWYVMGQPTVFLGLSGDIPVPGDYDGNGTTDRGIWRPSVGGWYVDGQATTFLGLSGDVPSPGDYDGNGKTDRGIWRPSVGGWYVDGQPAVFLGLNGDIPLPLPQAIYRQVF